jgi:hypothetical protein
VPVPVLARRSVSRFGRLGSGRGERREYLPIGPVLAVLEDLADEVEVLVLLVPRGGDLGFCCVF